MKDVAPSVLKSAAIAWLACPALLLGSRALAHHFFSGYFDDSKIIAVPGVATQLQLRNPQGLIRFAARDACGAEQQWILKTRTPAILERRDWTKVGLKFGEEAQMEGWPSRDGSHYLRRRARGLAPRRRPDGRALSEQAEQK